MNTCSWKGFAAHSLMAGIWVTDGLRCVVRAKYFCSPDHIPDAEKHSRLGRGVDFQAFAQS